MQYHEPWKKVTHQAGWVTLLHGANGAGKTTWLRHLAAMWAPVYYSGHTLGWIPHITVSDNINAWAKLYGSNAPTRPIPYGDQTWGDLSQGQKQYVAFIGAAASGCDLWLMDEPFAHMDTQYITQTHDMCRNHCKNGGALVLTAHTLSIDFWPHVHAWHVD